jgi:hypothetical protein
MKYLQKEMYAEKSMISMQWWNDLLDDVETKQTKK